MKAKTNKTLIVAVIFSAVTWFYLKQFHLVTTSDKSLSENSRAKRIPASSEKSMQNNAPIQIPKTNRLKEQSPDVAELKTHWSHSNENLSAFFDIKLINQTPRKLLYQVYFKGLVVDNFYIQQNANQPNEPYVFPYVTEAQEHSLLSVEDAKNAIFKKLKNYETITLFQKVYSLKDNTVLRPAYQYRVKPTGDHRLQTWTIDAATGEIVSVNTHSRH